ncbi:MAG: corrinoid protein [Bacteroidetes bacterium]|nr:corrinoid protein [Bacteroidota bacterium]MBU2505142.1 corrinoid protein [Bacteroidota bacterium]
MEQILQKISEYVEIGKAEKNSPYPSDLKGIDGASELTLQALEMGIKPNTILNDALLIGMRRIGEKFSSGKAFIPNLLISAKAMNAALEHLKPFFESGEAVFKGKIILGTVKGDLHDIGKNLVKMVMKGEGWEVVDIGVDVSSEKFIDALKSHPGAIVGLSALLTTTMMNMENIVHSVKEYDSSTKIFVGGAPLSRQFCDKIGADGYFPDPHSFAKSFHAN